MTRPEPRRQIGATAETLGSGRELRIHRHVLRALRSSLGAELTRRTAVRDGPREIESIKSQAEVVSWWCRKR